MKDEINEVVNTIVNDETTAMVILTTDGITQYMRTFGNKADWKELVGSATNFVDEPGADTAKIIKFPKANKIIQETKKQEPNSNVVDLPTVTMLDHTPEWAVDKLKEIQNLTISLAIGKDDSGRVMFVSSSSDVATINLMLDVVKSDIMSLFSKGK